MVQVGRTKTRLHSDLSERDAHSKSHPALYVEGGLGIKNVAIGHFTRNAAGSQSITGVGFTPKVVLFFAASTPGTYRVGSFGFDDGVNPRCIRQPGDSEANEGIDVNSISCSLDFENSIGGHITSMDADGFTITWELEGTIEAWVTYLAME